MPGPVVRDPRASSEEQLVAPPWLAPRGEEGGHSSFLFPQKMAATRPHRFVLDCLLSISRENDRNQTSSVCARLPPLFFFLGVLMTSDLIVVNASSPVLCVELCLSPSTSSLYQGPVFPQFTIPYLFFLVVLLWGWTHVVRFWGDWCRALSPVTERHEFPRIESLARQ